VFAVAHPVNFGVTRTFAQDANPSVDQIIKSLTPTGKSIKAGERGIRPSLPPGDERSTQMHGKPAIVQVSASVGRMSGKQSEDQPADSAPTIDLTVNFASGSADLTAQAIQTLDALGTALSNTTLAGYRFKVEGHTDTVGTREFNRVLSQQRAEAVVHYIATKFGLPASRMEPVGLGSDELLIPTQEQVAEPRNRRVKIVNLGS